MKERYFCTHCGREITNSNHGTTYCRKHQYQLEAYGKFLDNNPRNARDPNEIRCNEGALELDTYDHLGNVNATYKLSLEDLGIVINHKWKKSAQGYATATTGELLHRLIAQAVPGQQVDHINLDITDNRRENLRICGNSLNSSNRHPYGQSGIKGVEYHPSINKYSAYFRVEHKQYHSKCYSTIAEAAFARFILEQSFRKEPLTQFNNFYYRELSDASKQSIIQDIKQKFNL